MVTTTGKASEFITFSRTSNATLTDSDGKIKWAPHNLLLASEQFDASNWVKSNVTTSANSFAAPNATTTADTIAEDTATQYHYAVQTISTIAGVQYTASAFMRAGTQSYGVINVFNTTTASLYAAASFNLSTGAVVSSAAVGAGYAIVGSPSITPMGSGWYLCSVTFTNGTTDANRFSIAVSNDGTIGSYGMGNYLGASKTIYAWGAHLYRSDLGGMKANTSAYPMYNPTTPKNLLGASEDFSAAAWTKTGLLAFGSGSVANAVVAPNGLQTADKITENTATSGHFVVTTASVVSGTTYVFSAYAKAAERGFVMIQSNFGNNAYGTVNLSTGATNLIGGTGTLNAVDVGNGWWRISLTAASSVTSSATFNLYTATNSTTFSYTGDGTSGIYLWGAQLSDSASLDTYVPNYGAAPTAAAYYGPRLDFDPVTLAAKGLLVEEGRANLRTNSATSISSIPGTVLSTGNSSPDGTNAANGFTEDTSAIQRDVNINISQNQTLSFFVRRTAGSSTRYIGYIATNVAAGGAFFNLANGTVVTNSSSDFTATITPFGSYWRCSVTRVNAVAQDMSLMITEVNTPYSGSKSYTGDGASKFLFWGFQLEAGSFATSYIPTGAATATRDADVASVSTQAFPYSSTEGTWVANFQTLFTGTASSSAWIVGADNSNSKRIMYMPATDDRVRSFDGSTEIIATGDATGAITKSAAAFGPTDRALVTNGGTVATGAVASGYGTASVTTLGSSNSLSALNGHIRQITYLPRRITNTELQQRTSA